MLKVEAPINAPVAEHSNTLSSALRDGHIWIVIPCYKVRNHILRVIEKIPAWIEGIVCVDDACPENTADFLEAENPDSRLVVVRLPQNLGVGGAVLAGYVEAERRGGRILVKVDGDDQMDLTFLAQLVAPILLGEADYTKGNRFSSISHLTDMPRVRLFGNAALSFAAKVSTGYWNVFDPTNGFTAIEASMIKLLSGRRISQRFFFETDLLYHLGTLRAVVRDIPIPARYGDEVSNLRVGAIIGPFALKHLKNFVQRIIGQYFVRDFNVATMEMMFGVGFLGFGSIYALRWFAVRMPGEDADAGLVMTAALPVIVGVQLLLQVMNFDVVNVPNRPIHPYLRTLMKLEGD
ncbi:glycosyltransferase family 2 protein [Phenylobacterium sp. LH3H17]|uniref:glycosyltransferase family 2 protein n=1 Tax=Phenylobacterium sp. LH3H17 TaxID=2903901 RepID=UPI0020C9B660|nr:glycosyltransferase family 2 protein [Phenylobacterium sp. LH3H17]UTP40965.1 glycosyltransferase family 2 protein [Phenylobacterium sp. LH3H17]